MSTSSISYKIIHTVFLMCLILTLDSTKAMAQGRQDIFERFMKPMPETSEFSDADFMQRTKPIQDVPYGDKVLGYSMRVPKKWTKKESLSSSNFVLSEKLFLELVSYHSKPSINGRSRVEVSALNMDSYLTTVQWYFKHILEGGYTTEGLVAHNDNKIESLMIVKEGDNSYYVRSLITINGEKIIMVRYYVPVEAFKKVAAMQEKVIASFNITTPKARAEVPSKSYKFLDVAQAHYPENWEVFANSVKSANRIKAYLANTRLFDVKRKNSSMSTKEKATLGTIDVLLISSAVENTLLEEIEDYKKTFDEKGIILGERLKNRKEYSYHEDLDFHITEVYQAVDSTNNLSEYEVWFSVLVGGNYYYFITLLTPSRNEEFVTWAENIGGYEYAIQKFTPMSGAFLKRD